MCIKAFHLPKDGNSWEEYQDAWAWGDGKEISTSSQTIVQSGYTEACIFGERTIKIALADGASDAFESRLWSLALVNAFVQMPLKMSYEIGEQSEEIQQWLEFPMQTWKNGIPWDKLPYYAIEKARRGAFSTFLGVNFRYPSNKKNIFNWHAIALGDSCFFQIRKDELIVKFPINRSEDFDNYPSLISNQHDYNLNSLKNLRIITGDCIPGDLFITATDALAAWFLEQLEIGNQPWHELMELNQEKFSELVTNLRQMKNIRNDDMTLMIVSIENDQKRKPIALDKNIKKKYRM